jgi:prepilin-type N-terminal cleavage/methylation domain-containing protein
MHRAAAESGFTLIEALIAMGIAAIAAMNVATLLVLSVRSAHDARDWTIETTLAAQKLEELSASAWGAADLSISPDDALERDAAGYADRVDARGLPPGQAPGPSSSVFIRRWSVQSLARPGTPALVLKVFVTTPRRSGGAEGAGAGTHMARGVVLTTIRAQWSN